MIVSLSIYQKFMMDLRKCSQPEPYMYVMYGETQHKMATTDLGFHEDSFTTDRKRDRVHLFFQPTVGKTKIAKYICSKDGLYCATEHLHFFSRGPGSGPQIPRRKAPQNNFWSYVGFKNFFCFVFGNIYIFANQWNAWYMCGYRI